MGTSHCTLPSLTHVRIGDSSPFFLAIVYILYRYIGARDSGYMTILIVYVYANNISGLVMDVSYKALGS